MTSRIPSSSSRGELLALTDPELDLLRELLEEEPGAEVYADVARELIRRDAWVEAFRVLERAAAVCPAPRDLRGLHAKAAIVVGLHHRAIELVGLIGPDAALEPELVDVEVIARRAIGDPGRASALDEALAALHPNRKAWTPPSASEPPVQDRRHRPPRAPDPLITLARAEAYVGVGRPDRAIRVYRRLLWGAPQDLELRRRLSELLKSPLPERLDDLSDELPAPGSVRPGLPRASISPAPPGLGIPVPRAFTPAPIERQVTDRFDDDEAPSPGEMDEEITDTDVRRERDTPKRRRSLLTRK